MIIVPAYIYRKETKEGCKNIYDWISNAIDNREKVNFENEDTSRSRKKEYNKNDEKDLAKSKEPSNLEDSNNEFKNRNQIKIIQGSHQRKTTPIMKKANNRNPIKIIRESHQNVEDSKMKINNTEIRLKFCGDPIKFR